MVLENKKVIEVKNLNVVYNDRKIGLNALQDISFNINEHEFVSIAGPSGCGKSTLFRILSDTLDTTYSDFSGTVKVLGEVPFEARAKRKIGIVFQKPSLLEWRNVFGNVALPLEIMGYKKGDIEDKVNSLLKLVQLEKYSHFRPSQLSGGMQQKVSIARALAFDPEILLMDEPFSALDETNRRRLNDELIKIWEKTNKTVLFITHSIEEAVYLSQKIILLSKQPGTIKKIVNIDLPYPRNQVKDDVSYFNNVIKVRKLFESEVIFNGNLNEN